MSSQADAGSGVIPQRLMFNKGVVNRLNKFLVSNAFLLQAANAEYRIGDQGLWAARGNLQTGTLPPLSLGNIARTVKIIVLDNNRQVAIVTMESDSGTKTGYLYMYNPSDAGVGTYIGTFNVTDSGGLDAYNLAPELIQYGNEIYIAAGAAQGDAQVLDLSDIVTPEIRSWGHGWWQPVDTNDTKRGYTGAGADFFVTWMLAKPYTNMAGYTEYGADVIWKYDTEASTTGGGYVYKYRRFDEENWMRSGSDYVNTGTYEAFQPPWGHRVDMIDAGPTKADFDVWLTEYDAVNDIESSFSADIELRNYTPFVWLGDLGAVGGFPGGLSYGLPTLQYCPQEIRQGHSTNLLPYGIKLGVQIRPPTPTSADTFGCGGFNMRLSINKSNIRPSTTHIRVYRSRRGGAFPDGALINTDDIYVCSQRKTTASNDDPTIVGTTVVCGDGARSSVFLNLPSREPGIPVTDLAINHDTVGGEWVTPCDTLQIWDGDGADFFILLPSETHGDKGSDLFPVVESTVDGEGIAIAPQDTPPPKCSFGVLFNSSLVTDDVDNPGVVRWSVPDKPGSFPATYNYVMADAFVSARKMGRYMLLMGRNKLILSRYLVYEDLSGEAVSGAFIEVDTTRGAKSHSLTCEYTHPQMGPSVAFISNDNELWSTNGGLAKMLIPHVDLSKFVVDWTRTKLINNVAKQRLEFHYAVDPSFIITYDHMLAISYNDAHMLSDTVLSVMGPIQYGANGTDGTFVSLGEGPGATYGINNYGSLSTVGVLNATYAGVDILTGVINPSGLGKDWMVYSMRTAYRDIAGTLTQRVLAYRRGVQSYESRDLVTTASPGDGIIHHNVQLAGEGLQHQFSGHTGGVIDAIEYDTDAGVGPLSD